MMLKRIKELLSRRSKSPASGASGTETLTEHETQVAPAVHHGPRVVHQPIPQADLDADAVKIIKRLTHFDHGAYLVGGCVRDLLLDRRPKDFDIGTSATPRQVKRLFRNCRIIGRRFRLAHIYFHNGKVIEVATFRAQNGDEEAAASRKPHGDLLIRDDNLFGTMEEDALRRDFTINSLFYDVNSRNVLDHADGLGDLRRGLIRTIGDPVVRFREDPIRILRAIRFAARLGFRIESATLKALRETAADIPRAAAPRILEEINRFGRRGAARRSFELLRETGVFEVILPEIAESYAGRDGAWELLLAALDELDRRFADGQETDMGQILVLLLLPAMLERIGWRRDGVTPPAAGLDVRTTVDELLRPPALRLRIARKDQERCRQAYATLARLVPVGAVRRNARRTVLRRSGLPDALLVLSTVGKLYGGDYAEASDHWSRAASGAPPAAESARPGEATARGKRSRARGGRRGRRGGGDAARRTAAAPTRNANRKPQGDLPPVWDDDYFFAALPTVPTGSGEDRTDDTENSRREAPPVPVGGAAAVEPATTKAKAEAPSEPPRPRTRRRSRRRRRRPKTGDGKES